MHGAKLGRFPELTKENAQKVHGTTEFWIYGSTENRGKERKYAEKLHLIL